jgi:hypothetical protein
MTANANIFAAQLPGHLTVLSDQCELVSVQAG